MAAGRCRSVLNARRALALVRRPRHPSLEGRHLSHRREADARWPPQPSCYFDAGFDAGLDHGRARLGRPHAPDSHRVTSVQNMGTGQPQLNGAPPQAALPAPARAVVTELEDAGYRPSWKGCRNDAGGISAGRGNDLPLGRAQLPRKDLARSPESSRARWCPTTRGPRSAPTSRATSSSAQARCPDQDVRRSAPKSCKSYFPPRSGLSRNAGADRASSRRCATRRTAPTTAPVSFPPCPVILDGFGKDFTASSIGMRMPVKATGLSGRSAGAQPEGSRSAPYRERRAERDFGYPVSGLRGATAGVRSITDEYARRSTASLDHLPSLLREDPGGRRPTHSEPDDGAAVPSRRTTRSRLAGRPEPEAGGTGAEDEPET